MNKSAKLNIPSRISCEDFLSRSTNQAIKGEFIFIDFMLCYFHLSFCKYHLINVPTYFFKVGVANWNHKLLYQ